MQHLVAILQNRVIHQSKQLSYLFLADGENETAKITYGELDEKALAIAAYLQTKKLYAQRVLLLYPAGLDFIAALMGCLYAGVVAVPVSCPKELDSEKSWQLIQAIANDADIVGILTTGIFLPSIEKYFKKTGSHQVFIEDTTNFDSGYVSLYQLPEINEETIAYLQYTSGSTSTPKAAIITHHNLIHSLKNTSEVWCYKKKSITLVWAPHSHVYGLVCGLLVPLFHGSLSIIIPPDVFVRHPISWLRAITRYRVTHSGGPNFSYDLCVDQINESELDGLSLKSWKVAINGGELIQNETLAKFIKKFSTYGFNEKSFCPAYGMSELSGAITSNLFGKKPTYFSVALTALRENKICMANEENDLRKLVSCGQLLPDIFAAIVDPETLLPAAKGKVGEVWLAGKTVVKGYWQRSEETKEAFGFTLPHSDHSYFRTGDLGFVHNNELFLTGRLKEVIVVFGKKYYPADLEASIKNLLYEYAECHGCAVFSLSTSHKEQVIFLQEVNDDIDISLQNKIIHIIRHGILKYHEIDLNDVMLIKKNSLPKTPSGKLQRKICENNYLENKLSPIRRNIEASKSLEEVFKPDFIKLIAIVLGIKTEDIRLNDFISVYGFDSLNLIKLANLFNETYQVAISTADLFEYTTLLEFYHDLVNKHKLLLHSYYKIEEFSLFSQHTQTNYITDSAPSLLKEDNMGDIAVIGMSGKFPGAVDINQFWENLTQEKDVISQIPKMRWDWENYYGNPHKEDNKTNIKWGGFIDDIAQFDASFFNISPHEAELMDPQQRHLLQVSWKVIEDAGYSIETLSKFKTGLYIGAFNSDYEELLQQHAITDAYITTGIQRSILANRISYLFNLNGPSVVIDTACSSSLVAIHHAIQAIRNGDCEVAIAGGVNAILTPTLYIAANKAGMLSESGRCKTFDENANGYVRGEGVAAILLKPLHKAQADGDHIYGIIKGSAVNHGGQVSSLTVPNPNAQADVITLACQRANVPVNTISYVETHGTGTPLGDPIEINGLKKAFNLLKKEQDRNDSADYYCGLGSVKTNIGHLESAAGIASVIKVLLAMKHEQLPATLHFETLNPHIDITESPFYIVNKKKDWTRLKDSNGSDIPLRAGVSSFGFGGTNAHLILEEFKKNEFPLQNDYYPQLISLSAKTEIALQQRIKDLLNWLNNQTKIPTLQEISYTLNVGRSHFNNRCIFLVKSVKELLETLALVQEDNTPDNFIVNQAANKKIKKSALFQEFFKQTIREINSPTQSFDSDYQNKLLALGEFYTEGYDLDWEIFYKGIKKRISLPSYPFEKEFFWLPKNDNVPKEVSKKTDDGNSILDHIKKDFLIYTSEILKINPNKIDIQLSLSEQGFDSIAFNLLSLELEERYKIEFNPATFFTYHTINDLCQYLLDTYKNEMKSIYHDLPDSVEHHSQISIPTSVSINEPIAIIGMHGVFPKSENLDEFWNNLITGKDLVDVIPSERFDVSRYYGDSKEDSTKSCSKWGGFLENIDKFDAGFFNISPREANYMDPQHRLFLETAWKTIEDAGYDPFSLSGKEVGLFVGVEFNDYQSLMAAHQNEFHAYIATGNAHTMLPNRISYFLNFHGPSEVIDTACSSSLVAVHRAVNSIYNGECSVAIAGGINLILDPKNLVMASQLGVLSPDGRCKTFDASANGYVRGEGAAAILLKPLSQAEKDQDFIYGIIKGSAINHGGKTQSLTAPSVTAQSQLLIKAYSNADISPDSISYIETHGTGTELGDPVEIEGLKQAFDRLMVNKPILQKNYCGLGSIKTNIGHLEPASGIAGIIKVLLAMQHQQIPGNLHFNKLNPYINLVESPFYIANKNQTWDRLKDPAGKELPRRAGVSSYGFGGSNAHIILEEAPTNKVSNQNASRPYYLITLSAKQEKTLKQKIKDLYLWLKNHKNVTDLASISYTLNTGRSHFNVRCALVVNSLDDLLSSLELLSESKTSSNCLIATGHPVNTDAPILTDIFKSTIEYLENYKSLSPKQYQEKLLVLADLYIRNYSIDWNLVHIKEKNQRIAGLPSYPFLKNRYWFDIEFKSNSEQQPIEQTSTNNLEKIILNYLQQLFSDKLRLLPEQIKIDATYENYGIDSIINLEILQQLEKDVGQLPKTLLFEKKTLKELAIYFQRNFSEFFDKNSVASPQDQSQKSFPTQPNPPQLASMDIAIIGLTGTYPMAEDVHALWDNLSNGLDCITEVPADRWNYRDYPQHVNGENKFYKYGGFIADSDKFDPLFFNISPSDAALMDPQERLFMQSAWNTIEDAGYTRDSLQNKVNNEVGVFAGVTFNYYPLLISEQWLEGNSLPIAPQTFSIANRVSYFLNLNGPSYVVDTACSSSLAAIHLACESLRNNECKMAIAGGVNLSLHPYKYHMLSHYGFMSENGRCTSFGADGAGYVPGEGVGSVLLKPLHLAIKDGDFIYGVIKGNAMNHGGKTSGYTTPNPNAQAELIKKAIHRANIDPRTINYMEAHGTGTALGDPIEIRGLQEAFEQSTSDKQFCAIGSIKSNIGHLEAAAGISQLTKVLLQLQHKKLVPSLHAETLNPHIDFLKTPFVVQRQLSDWQPVKNYPRRAGISSFGAGGANVHLIIEEFIPSQKNLNYPINNNNIFVLSAKNTDSMYAYIKKMYLFLLKNQGRNSLTDICYTLQIGREAMPVKLAIVTTSYDDLVDKMKKLSNNPDEKINQLFTNNKDQINSMTTLSKSQLENLFSTNQYEQLAKLWINDSLIPWEKLYSDHKAKIISLPTYPFTKRRCWIPTNTNAKQTMPNQLNLSKTVEILITILTQLLGLDSEEIDHDTPFQNYGVDSIVGINFTDQLNSHFPNVISVLDLYRYPTVSQLAHYLAEKMPSSLISEPSLIVEQDEESVFLDKIKHLTDAEISQLIEQELNGMEELS